MKIRVISALLVYGIFCGTSLSAEMINFEKQISLDKISNLVIDQQGLRQFRIGISIMPVRTSIRSWNGEDLIVGVSEKSSFGDKNPISVTSFDRNGELTVAMSYEDSSFMGISIGRIDIDFLIPDHWKSDIMLKDVKTNTQIENLSIGRLTGNMSLANLDIHNAHFTAVDLSFGADSNFVADRVDAALWQLEGGVGSIRGENIQGEMNVKTLEGDINIKFSRFSGTSRFYSKLGKVTIGIPEDTQLELDMSSSIDSVESDLPLTVQLGSNNQRQIKGSIGSSMNFLSAHSGSEKVSVMALSGRRQ